MENHHDTASHAINWENVLLHASRFAVTVLCLFGAAYLSGLLLPYLANEPRWADLAEKHFAAIFGIPSAALMALFVVLITRGVSGPMEFEIWGLKLKGASGEAAAWAMCFILIVLSITVLWTL